jgi:hypothetical protein
MGQHGRPKPGRREPAKLKALRAATQKGGTMTRLDGAIKDITYVLDVLMAYRNIVKSGDCNECEKKKVCKYAPKPGHLVRYNCPFFAKEGEKEHVNAEP